MSMIFVSTLGSLNQLDTGRITHGVEPVFDVANVDDILRRMSLWQHRKTSPPVWLSAGNDATGPNFGNSTPSCWLAALSDVRGG
jgi:hypothetical protein